MKGKFQYVLFGAVITLFVISGALMFSLQRTAAQVSPPILEQHTEPTSLPEPTASATAVIETANTTEALDPALSVESSLSDDAQTSSPGTAENPQTNLDEIADYAAKLTSIYEESILGKPGWLLIQVEEYEPVEFRGNGEPAPGLTTTELYPDDITIFEDWYLIDEQGYYQQRVGHTRTIDGEILQRVVTANGESVNLTIQAADPNYEKEVLISVQNKVPLQIYTIPYLLRTAQEYKKSEVRAWHEDGKYVIMFTYWDEEPAKFMNTETLIYGSQYKYTIDANTGVLLSMDFLLNDGTSWFLHTHVRNYWVELVDKLPEDAQQTLTTASEK
jgi:hypothetical protein